jgi:hypothetical protein
VVDVPIEKLVARRIREQLGQGGLERLIEARLLATFKIVRRTA